MKRKFNLDKFKNLHQLSTHELQCIKGGKGKRNSTGGSSSSCPPPMDDRT